MTTAAAAEPADVPSEFGRNLAACVNCRLVKTFDQFYHSGCENCEAFLRLEGDQDRCSECTTPHFQGLISFIDPPTSWTAKWTHSEYTAAARFTPGVYALSVQAAIPEHIEEILVDNKVAWYKRTS